MNKLVLLIPHYNNFKGLLKSIKSIDSKEYLDILIVDDGSSIEIEEVKVQSNFKANGVVFFHYLNKNRGIEHALNAGLKIIKEKNYVFTARLDCGDVCKPQRFKKQQEFLEGNTIHLVGSNVTFIDECDNFLYNLKLPEFHAQIIRKMYLNSMLIHPSVMFKNDVLDKVGFYPTKYKAAEDYAFFFKIMKKFKVANLQEFLVCCELNEKGISTLKRKQQVKSRINIILDNFYIGFYPIYGLIRSFILLITPQKLILSLKKRLN